jgi:hypothetical protein
MQTYDRRYNKHISTAQSMKIAGNQKKMLKRETEASSNGS